jgi:hypothetical protein
MEKKGENMNKIKMNFTIDEDIAQILRQNENMSDVVNQAVHRFFNKTDDKHVLNEKAKEHIIEIEQHKCQLIDISKRFSTIIEEGNKADREEAEKQKAALDEKIIMRKQYNIDSFKPFFFAIKTNNPFFDKCFGNGSLLHERAWDDLTGLALEMNQAKIHTLKYDAYILWKIGKLYDDLKDLEPEIEVKEIEDEL